MRRDPQLQIFGCGSYALSRSQLEPKICGCKTDCALFTENGARLHRKGLQSW